MYKLFFCRDCYSADVEVFPSEQYLPFHTGSSDQNYMTRIQPFDGILPSQENLVFRNLQGLSVYLEGENKDREVRVYRDFYTGDVRTVLTVQKEERILQLACRQPDELALLNSLALERQMGDHGKYILHSSFIETEKGAILFTAPSGTGKSTQADLWNRSRGTEIINGDRSCIWKEGDRWMAGGVPWCGTSGIMKNRILPLRAVVLLKQGSVNELLPAGLLFRTARILEQLTVNPWNRTMLDAAQIFCLQLCREVPVLYLSCLPDEGAVETLERELNRL